MNEPSQTSMNNPPSNNDWPETKPSEDHPRGARGWYVLLIVIAAIGVVSSGALVLQFASVRGSQLTWQKSLTEIEREVERKRREHLEFVRTLGELKKQEAKSTAVVDDLEHRRSTMEQQRKTASSNYAKMQSNIGIAQSVLANLNSTIKLKNKTLIERNRSAMTSHENFRI